MSDRDIFHEAVALPPAERAAFVDRACTGDAAQRERLTALLAAHDDPPGFLDRPPTPPPGAPHEAKADDRVGPYTLRQKLGEGGCGVVWMAEQEQPLRRRVAVKVIKLGMDTREVIARFEAERQALAIMDHPNIAKVIDAGATESGRPFFVMELVRGVPITKYCDELALGTAARLELFQQVCHAVQHAHQKGVIHRDLKPSNILVTLTDAGPVPKVIDFGIAKATQGRLADQTIFTSFDQFIGTPAYISPEQAELSGLDIDTRSDIYSLGVLLYELLTGRTPFDPKELARAGLAEIRRRLRETEPPRPSTRLSTLKGEILDTIARQRHAAPPDLIHQVRGDLDWIVMRCLEKDRTRRYPTADALAQDLRRHLQDEPVHAQPPSRIYRLRKLVRRNRIAFASAGAIVAALIAGLLVAQWQAIRATRAEQAAIRASREQVRLRELAERAQANEATARARAESERQRAEEGEIAAKRRAYAADMQFVQLVRTWSNLNYARTLLQQHRPAVGLPPGWEWRYWWRELASDATSKLADGIPIVAFASSADGGWLAGLQRQLLGPGTIVIWNMRTGQQSALDAEAIVEPRVQTSTPFAFAPRAPVLAVAVTKRTGAKAERFLQLWDVKSSERIRQWRLAATCQLVQFSPDGERILTALQGWSEGNQVNLVVWRTTDGQQLQRTVLPGGSWMAVDQAWRRTAICTEKEIQMFDRTTGRQLWQQALRIYANALAFSPDGAVFASANFRDHGLVKLWNAETGEPLGELRGHGEIVTAIVFWPDGRTIATCSMDQTIRLWDTGTCALKRTLVGARGNVRSLALLADGTTLASCDGQGQVALWDTAAPERTRGYVQLGERIACWQFGSDSNSVLTVDELGVVTRWHGRDWRESDVRLSLGKLARGWDLDCVVEISAEPPLVAISRDGGVVEVWDWERRKPVSTIKTSASEALIAGFIDGGRKLLLKCRARSASDYRLTEWDILGGEPGRSWGSYRGAAAISLAPDARQAVVGSSDHWSWVDLISGTERKSQRPFTQRIAMSTGSISPDGRLIALPGQAKQIEIFDRQTLALVKEITGSVGAVTFSPDSRRLAVTSALHESVVLYDVDGWQRVLTLSTPNARISFPRFSPDGNVLGVMSLLAGNLFLWRAATPVEIEAAETAEGGTTRAPAPSAARSEEN